MKQQHILITGGAGFIGSNLADNAELRQNLAKTGQQCVLEQFTFQGMVDQIETTLQKILAG